MVATSKTRRQVHSLKKMAGMVSEQGKSRGVVRSWSILRPLSKHSLAEWPSFLEALSGEGASAMKELYSVFTFESSHSLQLRKSSLFKSCLFWYLFCDDVCSYLLGPSEERRKLSSLNMSLLKARIGILAHAEQK